MIDIKKIEKLNEEIAETKFSVKNKELAKGSHYLGLFGNVVSAIFAGIFVFNRLSLLSEDAAVWLLSIFGLIAFVFVFGFEYIKRIVFRKTLLGMIQTRRGASNYILFLIVSLIILAMSAWMSIQGSTELADRSKQKQNKLAEIKFSIKDSITARFDTLIFEVQKDMSISKKELEEAKVSLKKQQELIDEFYNEKGYNDRARVERKKEIINFIDKTEKNIEEDNKKILALEKNKKNEIATLGDENKKEIEGEIQTTKNNVIAFIIITTVIELFILFGVGFVTYYDYKYHVEFIDSPNYKNYKDCQSILNIIYYKGKIKLDEMVMPKAKIVDIVKNRNDIDGGQATVEAFLELAERLGIIHQTPQNRYVVRKPYLEAQKVLLQYFES